MDVEKIQERWHVVTPYRISTNELIEDRLGVAVTSLGCSANGGKSCSRTSATLNKRSLIHLEYAFLNE